MTDRYIPLPYEHKPCGQFDQWEPEPGSRAYTDQSIEQIAREIALVALKQSYMEGESTNELADAYFQHRKDISSGAFDNSLCLQAARLALLEGMKMQRERDAELGDKYADEVDQYHSTAGGFIRTLAAAIRSAMP